jgi:hypothetical protein
VDGVPRGGREEGVVSGRFSEMKILAVLALALVVLGCEGGQESGDHSQPDVSGTGGTEVSGGGASPTKVIVTSDDASLPDGCDTRQIAGLVIEFVDAFNRGDQERLSRLFFVSEGPSPPDFSEVGYYPWSWYLVSEVGESGRIENGFVTYDQGDLLRYFAERHSKGERLRLIKVSSTQAGLLEEESNVGIVYVLTRDAEDLTPGLGGPHRVAFGKGAINCESQRIFAWSIEMRMREDRTPREAAGWICIDPPGWRPDEAVVACS